MASTCPTTGTSHCRDDTPDANRGLVVLHDVRGSSIDPSAQDGFTSKMGIDATKPLGGDPAMFDKATLP
ncbi:MAG: hypothetical protein AABX97_01090 [Candidatus Thermoplasmatota archaeon]|mgnify:FL=1